MKDRKNKHVLNFIWKCNTTYWRGIAFILLCETDFWLNFLYAAKDCGASIALVNGKISERSLKRFKVFQGFSKQLFGLIDIFCLQSEHHRRRFEELNISFFSISIRTLSSLPLSNNPVYTTLLQKQKRRKSWS